MSRIEIDPTTRWLYETAKMYAKRMNIPLPPQPDHKSKAAQPAYVAHIHTVIRITEERCEQEIVAEEKEHEIIDRDWDLMSSSHCRSRLVALADRVSELEEQSRKAKSRERQQRARARKKSRP